MELTDVLRKALTQPRTFMELRTFTQVHDTVLTIALRNLCDSKEAVCGFVGSNGEWFGEEPPASDEYYFLAWYIPKKQQAIAKVSGL